MICKRLSAAMQSSDFHDLRLYWLSWNEKHSKKKKLPNSGIQSSTGLFLVSDLSVRRRVPNLLVSLKREKLKSSFVWISFLEKLHLYSIKLNDGIVKNHFVRQQILWTDYFMIHF